MRLSTKGRYAVRAMLELALTQTQNPVTRAHIADQQDLSAHYLAQLFLRLRKAGVIQSVKGPKGGYALARRPAEISVGEIIRAVDEPLMPAACVDHVDTKDCARAPLCATRLLWQQLGQQITTFVDSVTLGDLCEWDESLRDSTLRVVSR